MTADNKTDANSDPFLEAMAKKNEQPEKVSGVDSVDTSEIVFFFIMWLFFAGLATWGALHYDIHVAFAVLIGIVIGFVINAVSYILVKLGLYI